MEEHSRLESLESDHKCVQTLQRRRFVDQIMFNQIIPKTLVWFMFVHVLVLVIHDYPAARGLHRLLL